MPNLLNTAQQTVELAKKLGATDAWVTLEQKRDVSCEFRDDKIDKVKDATSSAIAIKLFVNGKYSNNSTSDLRPKSLENFLKQSIALASALQVDEFRKIPEASLFSGAPQVDKLSLYDPSIGKLDQKKRQEICSKMYAAVKGQKNIISVTSETGDVENRIAMASSNGFSAEYVASSFYLVSSLSMQDGAKKPEDYEWTQARYFKDLPEPSTISKKALDRIRAQAGLKKGPTAKTTLVLSNRASASIINRLLSPANAGSVQQKQSFWKDQLGQKKVSDKLTIIDNPLLAKGMGSRPFDSEGIASKELVIIEKGVFTNIYADTYNARKISMKPTTNGMSNVVIGLGDKNESQLLKDAGKGIYVTAWLGGNMDAVTGDFSIGVRGHEIVNGLIGAAIGEMNISGNIVDLFSRLVAVGNDPIGYSSIRSPSLMFEGVQFSGV